MSHSLEVRAPFLDPALVELALSLPARRHFNALAGKRLLRRALRGLVPRHVLRGPKRGFEVPVGHWLLGPLDPLFREIVTPRALADLPGFEPAAVEAWIGQHRARSQDHGRGLWSVFALCFWLQGPGREHRALAGEGPSQLRGRSSSAATVLRSSEG
jgi:asparagine synthase (glutamine-hydrolysing)